MSPWPFGIFQKGGDGRVITLPAAVMDYQVFVWRKSVLDRPFGKKLSILNVPV